jgi:translation initiation factor eIF-2B subunit epsilon
MFTYLFWHFSLPLHTQRTVIGNCCTINSNVRLQDSHLWQNVTIEDGATVNQSILCDGCTIQKGAVVGKGCIVGKDCVIGEGISLPDFTRVTLCTDDDDEDDDFGDFGSSDDDSGFSSSDEESSSEDDDEEEEEGGVTVGAAFPADAGTGVAVETDHDVVGKDGLGHVWKPRALEDEDDSDYDDFADSQGGGGGDPAEELVKSQSIGYDETHLFLKRLGVQEEEDDMFSDDEHGGLGDGDSEFGDDISFGVGGGSGMVSSNLDDGLLITGRQRGVDVVKELKQLCLEHETSSPIENLAIELNSFKFSQNATYSDCATGASLAILERIGITSDMTAPKLLAALKKELSHWVPLFHKFCHGLEEEKSIIMAMETAAVNGGTIGDVLGKAPSFRFILQTLHQEEVVGEEAILAWAGSRREGDPTSAVGKLFHQEPTQEFIEWLQDESESSDGESDED